jgi:hypothetical protein
VQVYFNADKAVGPSLKYVADFDFEGFTNNKAVKFEWRWLPKGGSEVYLNGKKCEVHILTDGWLEKQDAPQLNR